MAALRERRRDLRSGFVVDSGAGLDFWASDSEILDASDACFDVPSVLACRERRVLLESGESPAMDVSGTLVLRGGGGAESSECGW